MKITLTTMLTLLAVFVFANIAIADDDILDEIQALLPSDDLDEIKELLPSDDGNKKADANGCEYDLREGAVYTNENRTKRDADGNPQQNRLIVFARAADGLITEVQRVESGGYGNDAGIVTSGQFSVIISGDYVLMINAGFDPSSDSLAGSVSAFKVGKCRVELTDVKSTVGQEPRSVDRFKKGRRDLVATVNAGTGEVQFNGCPGLPEGFAAPTGITCGVRAPVDKFEGTSYTIYKFNKRSGKFRRIAHAPTRDENGDPAQASFINEGRQLIISQRNTFFALGDGTEDDIIEVVKLNRNGKPKKDRSGFVKKLEKILGYNSNGRFHSNDIAPRWTNPVVSTTTGNDNFGFSVFPRPGKDFNDCVIMTHGSFQQRGQGGTSVFTIDKFGAKKRIIPNKPDSGDDTCWTAISRTGTLYSVAFFNSEISIRGFNFETCNITDGGPPLDLSGAAPTFAPPPGNGLKHRVSSHPNRDDEGGAERNDTDNLAETAFPANQSDFLYEAGGLDMDITDGKGTEYIYNIVARVPFAVGQNSSGDWLYPPEDLQLPICDFGTCTATDIAIFRVVEDCAGETTVFGDDCRPGDLVFVGRSTPVPGSAFGMAAK